MWQLIKQYWRVTIFKESPANTPYSWLVFLLVYCLYVVVIVMQWQKIGVKNPNDALLVVAAFLLVFSYYVYTALLLIANRKQNRIVQTVTALLVSHLIILLISFLLLLISPELTEADMVYPSMRILLMIYILKTLLLVAWQFLIAAHIYKQALELDNFTAMLASIGLLASNILTIIWWQ